MEPLDPKAELMRLADEFSHQSVLRSGNWRDGDGENAARLALSAAITAALTNARREALEEAADKLIANFAGSRCSAHTCGAFIRALFNGKADKT